MVFLLRLAVELIRKCTDQKRKIDRFLGIIKKVSRFQLYEYAHSLQTSKS